MSIFKNLQRNMKSHHFIALFGLVVLAYAVMQYSGQKNMRSDGFGGAAAGRTNPTNEYSDMQNNPVHPLVYQNHDGSQPARAAEPAGQNEVYASVKGINTSSIGLPPSCTKGNTISDPADLLPRDTNSQWAQLNPAGRGDLKNVNLLKAGYHTGIDTIGSTLRNANLQVRSEPPNPTNPVSPWMNSTIEPDLMRAPLEIGCGSQ
jgi:hypothetical protein